MKLFILGRGIIFTFLSLISVLVCGQGYEADYSVQRAFACIIIDAQSAEPLEKATLRVGQFGRSADEAGRVEILANIGDTLVFTHVGYFPAVLEVKDSLFAQNIVAVSLSPDTIMLSEILVKPRRLTLTEEARQITSLEHSKNKLTNHLFASSTYHALATPSINRKWGVEENQRSTIGRQAMHIEYKGMIAPDQMIGVSSSVAIGAIVALIKKIADKPKNQYAVKPLSADELTLLLRHEQQTDK